jgi:hypothetical protein
MERPNTLSGLIDLHAEVAAKIEVQRRVMNRLVADLEAVEHTIRLLDPDAELRNAKRIPSQHQANKGEMRRLLMAALRDAEGPIEDTDLARQVIASRGLPDDAATLATIRKRVKMALWKIKAKGWAAEVEVDGTKGWLQCSQVFTTC